MPAFMNTWTMDIYGQKMSHSYDFTLCLVFYYYSVYYLFAFVLIYLRFSPCVFFADPCPIWKALSAAATLSNVRNAEASPDGNILMKTCSEGIVPYLNPSIFCQIKNEKLTSSSLGKGLKTSLTKSGVRPRDLSPHPVT